MCGPYSCHREVNLASKGYGRQSSNELGPKGSLREPKWLTTLSPREIIERIDELLEVTYRSGDLGNLSDVLSETIFILLSVNTRETVYQEVYRTLREQFPRWVEVENASVTELSRVLQPGGLQRQRARYLKGVLGRVHEDNVARGILSSKQADDDLTLEYLRDLRDADVEAFLTSLPGVGRKTARCVMAYALNRQQFAVDTHVARILTRLGTVKPGGTKIDHDSFQAVVPPSLRKRLHINLIHHGRTVCRTTNPKCGQCVLVSFCARGRDRVGRDDKRPVAIDLFAGAGGLGLGFRSAGWRVALAVERDPSAAQTYRANHPGTPVIEQDVATLSARDIEALCPALQEPHAVLAGPPCQGYSSAGAREPHNPKNVLYKQVVRVAVGLRAETVVIENVPGLHRVNGVGFADEILASLKRGRNAAKYEVLASDFGVPQNRRRVLFIARRRDLGGAPSAPAPTHSVTEVSGRLLTPRLEDVLRGVLEFPAGSRVDVVVLEDGSLMANVSTMAHSERVVAKIARIAPGKGPISYRRLERDIARTLVSGHRALPVHPWLHRTISVREAARIQGFPDTYVFCGSRANQPLQVANAVPPPLAAAVADHLLSFLPDDCVVAAARRAAERR
jgi:DNA (cytosine-5)-methyltransferase 1